MAAGQPTRHRRNDESMGLSADSGLLSAEKPSFLAAWRLGWRVKAAFAARLFARRRRRRHRAAGRLADTTLNGLNARAADAVTALPSSSNNIWRASPAEVSGSASCSTGERAISLADWQRFMFLYGLASPLSANPIAEPLSRR